MSGALVVPYSAIVLKDTNAAYEKTEEEVQG